jgi:RNA ligase
MIEKLEQYHKDGLLQKQIHPTLDLTIWNYSPKVQYERLWDEITVQCRGLVTNSKGEIVARPFTKFFNYEELTPEEIPNEYFDVYEKMDGSLGILFNYQGEWVLSTRGSFTSPQSIVGFEILKKYKYKYLPSDCTYLFEIIYPENRIVVDYGFEKKLVLLAVIQTNTGEEYNIHNQDYESLGFKTVTLYKTWGEGYDILKKEISKDKEGYVIRFKNGFRMKIKGEEYVRLHRIITNISNRDIWEYLKDGRPLDDILDKVPDEFYDWVKQTKEELLTQFETLDKEYQWIFKIINRVHGIENRGVFASYAKMYKHPNLLFNMLDGKEYTEQIWKLIYPSYSKPFKKNEEN